MDRSKVLTLIDVSYRQDEIGQMIPVETKREVFCEISSISASEWFDAGRNGLKAEKRAVLFLYDYNGEQTVELDGVRYGVYRTYLGKNELLELYLERKGGV